MNKKTIKILACILLLFFFVINSYINVFSYWVVEDDMDYSLSKPFKSEDIPLFVGQNDDLPESLSALGEAMLNTQSFRIPSLLYAKSHSKNTKNTLIAAIDRASSGADWGKIDIAIRRSYDNGETWSDMQVIVSPPVRKAPQDSKDWASAFCIDPAMIQSEDGSIVLLVTMYPESKGLHESKWLEDGSGYITIDEKQYMALYAEDSNVGKNGKKKQLSKNAYTIREDGWIFSPEGIKTNYYVPQNHSSEHNYETIGDMYYAVGKADYIDKVPPLAPKEPENEKDDIYVGNIYLSYNKPGFSADKPQYVGKTLVAPWKEGGEYSAYQTYETSPAPLRAAVTSYVWMLKSKDNGLTWEQPEDITGQIKIEEDGDFLGVCPGLGLILKNQSYAGQINRILFPLYKLGKATIVYSDDNGKTWQRASSKYIENVDEVQCIELLNGSILAFGRQEALGKTPVSISLDGGQTWRKLKPTDLYSVKCQKSVISLPLDKGAENADFVYPEELKKGEQYVIASHPSGNLGKDNSRSKGVISLGMVKDDHSIEWLYQREIKDYEAYAEMGDNDEFFAYSCLTVLENGNIGLMYEAYPSGYLAFTQFNLNWLIEGGSPIQPKSKLTNILKGLALSVLLVAAVFFVHNFLKNRVNYANDADFEDEIYEVEIDAEDAQSDANNAEDYGGIIIAKSVKDDKSSQDEYSDGIMISNPKQKPQEDNNLHDNIPIGAIRIGKAHQEKAKPISKNKENKPD